MEHIVRNKVIRSTLIDRDAGAVTALDDDASAIEVADRFGDRFGQVTLVDLPRVLRIPSH